MGKGLPLEELKEVFRDDRQHIGIGKIKKLALLSDKSALRVQVAMWPDEEREIIATMSWDAVGPDSGNFTFPVVDDLVLVAFAEGDPDQAFVIKRLTSKTDTIPPKATEGHSVMQALAGKKAYVASDDKILLGKRNSEPTEPLVLGNVLKTFLTEFFDTILNAPEIGICAVGPVWLAPAVREQLLQQKDVYIDTMATNILSQLGYTERGGS